MRGSRPLTGVLAVALVLAGCLIGPTTATAVAAAPPSISIRVEPGAVGPGDRATVAGVLRVPGGTAEGRVVAIEARSAGEAEFLPIGAAAAGPNGGLSFVVLPAVTTRFRWRYVGADDAVERVSGVVTVKVRETGEPSRRTSTTMSIRAVRPAVAPGAATAVRGQLRATSQRTLLGRWVVLLSKSAGADTWQFRHARRTDRAGRVNFLIRPRTHTSYRLGFAGTQTFQPARSGVVQVRVRPTVTIAAEPGQVDPEESTTVTGTVTGADGAPVAGATVDLMAREASRGATWAVVASTTTSADGSALLLTAPTATSRYRLWVRASTDTPSAHSTVVTVAVRSPSSLSIRGRTADTGFVVSGRLVAEGRPVRGEEVALRSYDAATSTWVLVATAVTGRRGWVSFVQPPTPGASYRLDYDGTRFTSSSSATLSS